MLASETGLTWQATTMWVCNEGWRLAEPRSTTTLGSGPSHVPQHIRPSVPRHHLGREPRAGDRLRGRWLPAAHPAGRGRYPALAGSPPPRPVALHHAAPGAGRGPHPVRRVRRRDHRHADRHADRQRGPAFARLFGDRGAVPAWPRRPDLRAEIRRSRLSRRRPVFGARDRDAGGGGRRGAQGAGRRRAHPRRAGADRTA